MAFDNSLFKEDAGYYKIRGIYLPGKFVPNGRLCWTEKAVEAALNMDLKDSDVLFATYPKTGQTWTLVIMHLIMAAKELEEGKDVLLTAVSEKMPFIETEREGGVTAADIFQKLDDPRIMKSHLPYALWKQQLEKHPNMRVLQIVRNPKDTLVSFYHHMSNEAMLGGFNGTWDQYFELFKEKKLPWGDFFEVTADWFKFFKNRKNTLILLYEEMKKDHRGHVLKIAKFLGQEISDKVADKIVERSTVKDMSKEINARLRSFPTWNKEGSFVRKGEVGDWVNYFSKEQSDYIDAKCKEYLEPLGLTFDYTA